MRFGDKLDLALKRTGKTAPDVSRALGGEVSPNTVRRWIAGSDPKLSEVQEVATYLQLPIAFLADDNLDEMLDASPPDSEVAAIDMVRSLNLSKPEVIRRLSATPEQRARATLIDEVISIVAEVAGQGRAPAWWDELRRRLETRLAVASGVDLATRSGDETTTFQAKRAMPSQPAPPQPGPKVIWDSGVDTSEMFERAARRPPPRRAKPPEPDRGDQKPPDGRKGEGKAGK